MTATYRDIRFHDGYPGYPQLTVVDDTRVLIGTSNGDIVLFDISVEQAVETVFVGTNGVSCINLGIPALAHDRAGSGVGTRGSYAALWTFGGKEVVRLEPERYAPVSCFSFLPQSDGNNLCLLGLGSYPLDLQTKGHASLELWSLQGIDPQFIRSVPLPGSCTDVIVIDDDYSELICAAGLRSVLVQREMDSGRSLLASIQPFREPSLDGHRPM